MVCDKLHAWWVTQSLLSPFNSTGVGPVYRKNLKHVECLSKPPSVLSGPTNDDPFALVSDCMGSYIILRIAARKEIRSWSN